MTTHHQESNDRGLAHLLRENRPELDVPPGFRDRVWRQIARAEATETMPEPHGLVAFARWLLYPRRAYAGIAAMLVLGGLFGTLSGLDAAHKVAQARYVASVAPPPIP